jgi:hypothetical protein
LTGPSSATSTYDTTTEPVGHNTQAVITSLVLAAGSYVVEAKTTIGDNTSNTNVSCLLVDSTAGSIDETYTSSVAPYPAQHSLSLMAPLTTTGSTVSVECDSDTATTIAADTHIIAIKLGSVSGAASHSPGDTANRPSG